MTVYLVYNRFLDTTTREPTIGGIQSYIIDLSQLIIKTGHSVVILQQAGEDTSFSWNGCEVKNVHTSSNEVKSYQKALKYYFKKRINNNDLIVFMTHTLAFPLNGYRVLTIQHGIYWDVPKEKPRSIAFVEFIFRNLHSWKDIRAVNQADTCIAVDYNFLNWYKTQQYYLRSNIKVIPNYCRVLDSFDSIQKSHTDVIKILFARRFEKYRGTRIFSEAVDILLERFTNVYVTFAGSGPDEDYLRQHYETEDRVGFITYEHNESMEIHSQYDIAVVASIGSEGTSLSLLEAMGAGCAVVSTNVGGLTNIIIHGFNGLMADITSASLVEEISRLVTDKKLRMYIANNGYITVKNSFNKGRWDQEWISILKQYEMDDADIT